MKLIQFMVSMFFAVFCAALFFWGISSITWWAIPAGVIGVVIGIGSFKESWQ